MYSFGVFFVVICVIMELVKKVIYVILYYVIDFLNVIFGWLKWKIIFVKEFIVC